MNSGSVPVSLNAATAGAGMMMVNSSPAAAMNQAAAASGLLMPGVAAAAGNAGLVMHRPFMLQSAGSPATAAGYLLASGAANPTHTLMPQYVVGYPGQSATSPELAGTYAAPSPYAAASPYGMSMPPGAVYGI